MEIVELQHAKAIANGVHALELDSLRHVEIAEPKLARLAVAHGVDAQEIILIMENHAALAEVQ